MAPGPTPTLTTSAPASTRSPYAVGGHDVAGNERDPRPVRSACRSRTSRTAFSACEHLLLVPVRRVDHEDVDPDASRASARPATSPLIPTAAPMISLPVGSSAGRYSVDRSACLRVITPTSRSSADDQGDLEVAGARAVEDRGR